MSHETLGVRFSYVGRKTEGLNYPTDQNKMWPLQEKKKKKKSYSWLPCELAIPGFCRVHFNPI